MSDPSPARRAPRPRTPREPLSRAQYDALVAEQMLEGVLLTRVTNLASAFGWRWFHAPDNKPDARGRRQRVTGGWPDLVLVHERVDALLVRELKRQKEKPREDQRWWLDRLGATGVDVGVWRPLDLLELRIERELANPVPRRLA